MTRSAGMSPMTLDPHVQRLLAMLSALGAGDAAAGDINSAVAPMRNSMDMTRPAAAMDCDVCDFQAPGPSGEIALRLTTPSSARSTTSPGMIYVHGGGWVAGSLDRMIASRAPGRASGCRMISVDYRLAPEQASRATRRRRGRHAMDRRRPRGFGSIRAGWRSQAIPRRRLAAALCHVFLDRARRPSRCNFFSVPSSISPGDAIAPRIRQGLFHGPRRDASRSRLCLASDTTLTVRCCRRCASRSSMACRPPISIPPNSIPCVTKAAITR